MDITNQRIFNLNYHPSPKALEFYASGLTARQRMWLGAVRSLKTSSVVNEVACHLHGQYPKYWNGYRYDRPTRWLVGTVKATKTRDVLQKYFLEGDKGFNATVFPFIHPSLVENVVRASGLTGAIDRLLIRHSSGGISQLKFVSFSEGASGLQSETFDGAYLDEAPDFDVYNEVLYRTTAFGDYKTFVLLTMWPEHGRDELVDFFMNKGSAGESVDDHFYMHSSWQDNPFMTDDEKARLRAATPAYLLEAREHGLPIFGVGKVFTMKEEDLLVEPFDISPHFRMVYGLDPSVTSNGYWGAVLLAYDPDRDVVYVVKDYKQNGITMSEHHDNLYHVVPDWCPGVCDPAGNAEHTITKEKAMEFLINRGRDLTKANKANKAKEATIGEIEIRSRSGKFKIFNTCNRYLDEWRRYSRDEKGCIIKENDHCLDASFYALRALDMAKSRFERDESLMRSFGFNRESGLI